MHSKDQLATSKNRTQPHREQELAPFPCNLARCGRVVKPFVVAQALWTGMKDVRDQCQEQSPSGLSRHSTWTWCIERICRWAVASVNLSRCSVQDSAKPEKLQIMASRQTIRAIILPESAYKSRSQEHPFRNNVLTLSLPKLLQQSEDRNAFLRADSPLTFDAGFRCPVVVLELSLAFLLRSQCILFLRAMTLWARVYSDEDRWPESGGSRFLGVVLCSRDRRNRRGGT